MGSLKDDYWTKVWQHGDFDANMTGGGQGLEHPSRAIIWDHIPPGSHVLDVGCCNALMFKDAKARDIDIRYTGIDTEPTLIETCRIRYPQADFYISDAQDLRQFADNSFDIVHARHLIDHLPHYSQFLVEAFRVARTSILITTWRPLLDGDRELLRWGSYADGGNWGNQYNRKLLEDFIDREFGHYWPNQPLKDYQITMDVGSDNSLIIINKKEVL